MDTTGSSDFLRDDGEAPFDESVPLPLPPAEEKPLAEPDPANDAVRGSLLEGTSDPLDRERTRWYLEFARAELRPAPLDRERAAECAGHYDGLDVLLFGDGLALATDDADLRPILPFDRGIPDVYYFPDIPDVRALFVRDASGLVVTLRVFSYDGEPRDHRRTD